MTGSLKERIGDALRDGMKQGDKVRVSTIRLLMSAIHNREIEKRGQGIEKALADEEVEVLLRTEAKKRREAIALFEHGARADLAFKEKKELSVIEGYLPVPLGEHEIRAVIRRVIAEGAKEFGPAMKRVMQELKGRGDGAEVARLLKEQFT